MSLSNLFKGVLHNATIFHVDSVLKPYNKMGTMSKLKLKLLYY